MTTVCILSDILLNYYRYIKALITISVKAINPLRNYYIIINKADSKFSQTVQQVSHHILFI